MGLNRFKINRQIIFWNGVFGMVFFMEWVETHSYSIDALICPPIYRGNKMAKMEWVLLWNGLKPIPIQPYHDLPPDLSGGLKWQKAFGFSQNLCVKQIQIGQQILRPHPGRFFSDDVFPDF